MPCSSIAGGPPARWFVIKFVLFNLYRSDSVFPLVTTIFLERFPVERESFFSPDPPRALNLELPASPLSWPQIGGARQAWPTPCLTP